jgi:hypothetical protein
MSGLNDNHDLNIQYLYPSNYDINIHTTDSVEVEFTNELNSSTILKNFVILEDIDGIYKSPKDLKRVTMFNNVTGSISYNNMRITFTPTNGFNINSRYIICIKSNGLMDINSQTLQFDFISTFYTELTATIDACYILSPSPNSIFQSVPTIGWDKKESDQYIIQISKQSTFETLIYDEFIIGQDANNCTNTPNINLVDGLYYVRVKALCGLWTNSPLQFYIRNIEQSPVTQYDDNPDDIFNLIANSLSDYEILDVFPNDQSIQISTTLQNICINVSGKVDIETIDMTGSYVEGILYDADDSDVAVDMSLLSMTLFTVYDNVKDITSIIYNLESIGV